MDIDYTRKPTTNIYYDSRIAVDSLAPYQGLLETVFQGDTTNGDRVEKLKNHYIFSVRTNNKGRILFTFQVINGQNSLLVLELLENHEYDKAKFLKKNVLKKYLEKNQTEFNTEVQDTDFEPSDILNKPIIDKNKIIFKPVLDNSRGHIVLDTAQETVFLGQTPMIIEGPPGSGKTSLAEGLVRRALNKDQSVLLVTRSARLAKKIYQNLSESPEFAPNKVKIVAYSDLFTNLIDNGKPIFDAWYVQFSKQGFVAEELYEEFRILSGYDLKDYISESGIGQKQTRFQLQEDRKKIAVLYKIWLSYLAKEKIKLSDFYSPSENEIQQFDLVVLDEAQDFSHLQLKNLTAFAKNKNMITCIDRRQNIEDENPKMIYIKNMMSERFEVIPNIVQVSTPYRCPQNIMGFAQVFNELRLELNPKLKAEPKIESSPNQDGTLVWLEPNNKNHIVMLQEMKNNPDLCVITHEKFKQEALQSLGIIQVFTPEEIKGFEYKIVILYKILETQKAYEANALLNPNNKNKAQEGANCSAELSACFVSATRPTEALYFVQNSTEHNLKFIIPRLKNKMPQSTPAPAAGNMIEVSSIESAQKAWEARAKEAVERNDIQTARNILQKHMYIIDPELLETKIQEWQKEYPVTLCAENKSPQKIGQKKSIPQKVSFTPEKSNQASTSTALSSKEIEYFKTSIATNSIKKIRRALKDQRYIDLINSDNCDSVLIKIIYTSNNTSAQLVQKLIKVNHLLNEQDADGYNLLMFTVYQQDIDMLNLLIQRKVDLNLQNNTGNTALNIATHLGNNEAVNLLIQAGANLNLPCHKGFTALLTAAQYGHTQIVKQLLQGNVDLNLQNIEGSTALMYAACLGYIEIVHLLIQAKADINLKNLSGESALMLAIGNRHAVIAKKLIEAKANINFKNRKGATPLMIACGLGYDEILEIILEANPDLNLQNTAGYSALMIAIEEGHLDIANRLIDANADLNLQNDTGYSALMLAVEEGDLDIVKRLIDSDADLNLQDYRLFNALIIASYKGHVAIVEKLIQAHANLNLQDANGDTALIWAIRCGHIKIVEILLEAHIDLHLKNNQRGTALAIAMIKGDIDIIEKLTQAGANVNLQDINGITPLILATQKGDVEIVEKLVQAGANVNLQDEGGNTALIWATVNGHLEIIKTLLAARINLNLQNNHQNSALMIAAGKGQTDVAAILIQAGADVNLQDQSGNTALIWAVANGHIKVVEQLIQANANPNITDNQGYTPFMIALRSGNWELINMLASGINSFCSINNHNNEEIDLSFINQSTFKTMPDKDMYQVEEKIENIYSVLECVGINKPKTMLTQYQSTNSVQLFQAQATKLNSEERDSSHRFKNS